MYVLSAKEMYFYDSYTINEMGIPGIKLMENAGKGSFERIKEYYLKNIVNDNNAAKIIVFAGTGNNGGDGFVVARYLKENGFNVEVIVTGNPEKMSEETKTNYEKCKNLDIMVIEVQSWEDFRSLELNLSEYYLIIDAIFGVGLKGDVQGWKAELINHINEEAKHIVSIDVPSGLNADTGEGKPAIYAEHTFTMAAIKQGMLLENGRKHCGKIEVIDIGMPKSVFEQNPPKSYLINDDNVIYPERDRFAHKGKYGKIVIIAGSRGFSGAAIMSSQAALRAGGGLIYLLHPEGMETIFELATAEVITKPIEMLADNINFYVLKDFLKDKDALLIGPGLGVNEYSYALIDYLSKNWEKPLVIDADGLNTIAKFKMINKFADKKVILTPHLGEFARLSGKTVEEILHNRIEILNEYCNTNKVSVLLKGSTTIFCNGENFVYDISGNDGLATGGSGDVLSGIIVSFLGQGLQMKDAAISASYLMGKTAEHLEKYRLTPSIIPTDIIEHLFYRW